MAQIKNYILAGILLCGIQGCISSEREHACPACLGSGVASTSRRVYQSGDAIFKSLHGVERFFAFQSTMTTSQLYQAANTCFPDYPIKTLIYAGKPLPKDDRPISAYVDMPSGCMDGKITVVPDYPAAR